MKTFRHVFAALTILTLLALAAAQPITLKISTQSVPDDWHTEALYVFQEYLEENAPDAFDVQVYPSGQLFPGDAELAALQRGNLEMAYISAQTLVQMGFADVSPLTAGYVVKSPEQLCSIWRSDLGNEWRSRIAEEHGVYLLDDLYLGTRQLNLRTTDRVETPADLEGIKLRMPPSDAWLFLGRALGATPTPLAFGELYLGLQTGTVDGQDNPLPTVRAAKFYEVTEQIVLTDHLVDGVILSISGRVWDRLDEAQQQLIWDASHAALQYNNTQRVEDEAGLVAFFESEGLDVYAPDTEAFRSTVLSAYLDSEFSADWPEGIIANLDAIETHPSCVFR